jgi:N-acyl-D-aspartate/D-glutamate deacylase
MRTPTDEWDNLYLAAGGAENVILIGFKNPALKPLTGKTLAEVAPGDYADIVVFDPATIQDHATFAEPHQYATGVDHVIVNGTPVLLNGEHTGAKPGRFVRGPGWKQ